MHFILPRFFVNCERWKWNDDFRVYVSTHGHIKDEYKKNVAPKINQNGYFMVRIKHDWTSVHRLVLMTWRPLPNNGEQMTVDHLDSNRRNNHLENLEWCSAKENQRRAAEMFVSGAVNVDGEKLKSTTSKNTLRPVSFDNLKEYGIVRGGDKSFNGDNKEKLRRLFEEGIIITLHKGHIDKPITLQDVRNSISENELLTCGFSTFVDRFLWRALCGAKYLGYSPRLFWRDAN